MLAAILMPCQRAMPHIELPPLPHLHTFTVLRLFLPSSSAYSGSLLADHFLLYDKCFSHFQLLPQLLHVYFGLRRHSKFSRSLSQVSAQCLIFFIPGQVLLVYAFKYVWFIDNKCRFLAHFTKRSSRFSKFYACTAHFRGIAGSHIFFDTFLRNTYLARRYASWVCFHSRMFDILLLV